MDLKSLKMVRSFDTPQTPAEILIQPDGGAAYISCIRAGKTAVLDLQSWQMQEPLALTPGVDGLVRAPAIP